MAVLHRRHAVPTTPVETDEATFDTEIGKLYLDNLQRLHVSERTQKVFEEVVKAEQGQDATPA